MTVGAARCSGVTHPGPALRLWIGAGDAWSRSAAPVIGPSARGTVIPKGRTGETVERGVPPMVFGDRLVDPGVMAADILVVDNDPGFRRMAKTLLTARGLHVIAESADGASAIEAVRQHRPDGLLLDMYLPDQDGISLARALKGTPHCPKIVMTSTDQSLWASEELADAGVALFIAKDRLLDVDLGGVFRANS